MKRWDIFCKIVDNFGDIGVCWRLARQLAHEYGIDIRLWIDDLTVARQLIPTLDTSSRIQLVDDITIAVWDQDTHFEQASDAVVEAFGCELPETYLALMKPENIWINLEYLSAEAWVEGFHAKHSKRGHLIRHFFFPGFTPETGGLLRENDIIEQNRRISTKQTRQADFFRQLNLPAVKDSQTLQISLFSYPHAPIHDLLTAIAESGQQTICYVPATGILPKIAEFFGKPSISPGDMLSRGNLNLHVLPFLSQDDYDKLLASCDINFVRGEDSWVRAIWAAKPFIWQPYLQSENTHLVKLQAFLDLYYQDCDSTAAQTATALHHAWTSEHMSAALWRNYLADLDTLKAFAQHKTTLLTVQADLATNLVIYIEKLQHNHI